MRAVFSKRLNDGLIDVALGHRLSPPKIQEPITHHLRPGNTTRIGLSTWLNLRRIGRLFYAGPKRSKLLGIRGAGVDEFMQPDGGKDAAHPR